MEHTHHTVNEPSHFTFTGRQKGVLLGGMILGLLCLVITFLTDDPFHTRFWTNYLHNTVFFLGIAFISVFIIAAFTTAYAGWFTIFKRIWEAYGQFLVPALVLLSVLIIGVWTHAHHLYHWTDETAVTEDAILSGKSSFLNKYWYTFGSVIIMGIWIFFAHRLRSLSLNEDLKGTDEYRFHTKIKWWAAAFLPIAGFSSAAAIWQWIMSIDSHWYSTMFAWYVTASWFVSAIALTILSLIFLKSRGYYQNVTDEHLHDLGKYLFAFSIFWTYVWFSQFMLIWYSNNGEETIYFFERMHNYPVLFWGNLLLNFVLPFLILLPNTTKRLTGTLTFMSILVLFGHWWDFFQMIKPGAMLTAIEAMSHGAGHAGTEMIGHAEEAGGHAAMPFRMGFTIPGLLEIGTMLGFLSGFIYFFFWKLSKAPLVPVNDPYIEESMHHHV